MLCLPGLCCWLPELIWQISLFSPSKLLPPSGVKSMMNPSCTASHHQKAWYTPQIQATYDALLDASPDKGTYACLLAVATNAWLNSLPVSSLDLRMDDEVVRIVLGMSLCEPHLCQHCGAEITTWEPKTSVVNSVRDNILTTWQSMMSS